MSDQMEYFFCMLSEFSQRSPTTTVFFICYYFHWSEDFTHLRDNWRDFLSLSDALKYLECNRFLSPRSWVICLSFLSNQFLNSDIVNFCFELLPYSIKLEGGLSFNWNHFEMRLLNLRINFLFIADFLSSSW